MSVIEFVYFFSGSFVIFVALFKRELLNKAESFRIILGISVVMFVTGLIVHFLVIGRFSAYGALFVPLLCLGLYRLMRRYFVERLKREPRDTAFDFSSGMVWDRTFNILYFIMAISLWMLLPGALGEISRSGWRSFELF